MRRTIFVLLWVGIGSGCGVDGAPNDPATMTTTRECALDVAMRVDVEDVASATDDARATVDRVGGFVAESNADEARAHLELRVPAAALDEARASLACLGRVITTSETAEDVTLAHADVRSRLESARAEEARLSAMFVDRTSALADVLAVERELSRVQTEIAQRDAEERVLSDRVAMARVSLDLARATPAFTSAPATFVAEAAISGVRFASAAGIALTAALAFAAPSLLALFAIRLAWRVHRRRLDQR